MCTLQVELPESVLAEVTGLVAPRGISQSEWLAEAVREKLAAETKLENLAARAARGDRSAFERVLAKVPAVDPLPGDEK
jgi:metal-responsive CopG/Arc/MetJ family transcriptional regulator